MYKNKNINAPDCEPSPCGFGYKPHDGALIFNTMEKEIWKDVPGYEGLYQVSNLGRVKSLMKHIKYNNGIIHRYQETILKPYKRKGYYYVVLSKNTLHIKHSIHRLVALCFIPNTLNKCCVNHLNGIKTDNRLINLEWVTYSENSKHSFRTGLQKPTKPFLNKKGKLHPRAKLIGKYSKNNELLETFYGMCEAERATGIKQPNISKVINNKRHFAGGFKWKYIN